MGKNQCLKLIAVIFSSIFILTVSSCKNTADTEEGTSLGNAHVLAVNGIAGSSAIDIYWTGNKLNTAPLLFGETTGYRNMLSGVRFIQIKANATNKLMATDTIRVVRDLSYTYFVFQANGVTTSVIAEDDLSIPSSGNAKIKFVNMSAGLSSADLNISGGPSIASDVQFGTIGSYTELKAGTYNLTLNVHGSSTALINVPNVMLAEGKIYTIWSRGNSASSFATKIITQ